MWENQLSWLVAMFPPVQAMMLPNDAVNGLWIVTGDANWNSEAPIRLDHTSKPDPKLIENDRRERTEASTWTWRRTICASSGDPAQQSGSGFRPAWPWRRMETVKQQPDGEFKNVESVGDDTLTVTDSARDGAGCGQNLINDDELRHALQQMVDYCDHTGFVEAYQNVASKWGSTVVYICARGHIESCYSDEFVSAITYIHYACAPETGWVYNNFLYPDRPASKCGMDVTGADFCLR